MKLRGEYVLYEAREDETLLVATETAADEFKDLIRANESASFILNCLTEETTKEVILEKMLAVYNASSEELEGDIEAVLEQLRTIGALEE